jgi:hypothetical protein
MNEEVAWNLINAVHTIHDPQVPSDRRQLAQQASFYSEYYIMNIYIIMLFYRVTASFLWIYTFFSPFLTDIVALTLRSIWISSSSPMPAFRIMPFIYREQTSQILLVTSRSSSSSFLFARAGILYRSHIKKK